MATQRFGAMARFGVLSLETVIRNHAKHSGAQAERNTNDKIDLRTKVKHEICVTHEVDHFDSFDDSHCCNTLASVYRFSAPIRRNLRMKHTPTTLRPLKSSALSSGLFLGEICFVFMCQFLCCNCCSCCDCHNHFSHHKQS